MFVLDRGEEETKVDKKVDGGDVTGATEERAAVRVMVYELIFCSA